MFENLTERLNRTFKNLSGQGKLTEENIEQALKDMRLALLEADVALSVVKQFLEKVKNKALGKEVLGSLQPDQALVKIAQQELIHVLGDTISGLNLKVEPPAAILMAG